MNSVPIDKDQFHHALEAAAGPAVIHKLVQDELTLQFAQKKGMAPTDAKVDAKYLAFSLRPGFSTYLASHRMTPEDFKQSLRISMARAAVVGQGVTVSDADIKKFYDENTDPKNPKARYFTPETVQLAVIVTRTEAEANAALG